jgi:hypothetical protein
MGPVLLLFAVQGSFLALSMVLNEAAYFIGGAALAAGVYVWWARARRVHDLRANLEATRRLAAGDFGVAMEGFDALCTRPTNGSTLAVFLMNRGTASLCQGDFESALSIYHEVLRAEHGVARAVFKIQGDVFRARCADALAAYGDLDGADELLSIHTTHELEARLGMQLFARSVLALRRGDAQGAWDQLAAHWRHAEDMYSATELKMLVVVRAFAAAQLQGSPKGALGAELTAQDLQRHQWLGTHWPEMVEILRALQSAHDGAEATGEEPACS